MEETFETTAEVRNSEGALLSVVVPVYNEEELLDEFFGALLDVLNSTGYAYEIIAINDGSVDGSLKTLLAWRSRERAIKVVDLSRNFGKDVALLAGIDAVRGDAVVLIDADLQHPPEVIPEFLAAWEEGYDDVYGIRSGRTGESRFRRLLSRNYYHLFNFVSNTKIPAEAGDFRLLSRRAVDALRLFREQQPFLKGLYSWIGFDSKRVLYRQNERRAGGGTWTLGSLLSFGLGGIFSFSYRPLRLATILGTLMAAASLIYAVYFWIRTIVYGADVPGYPSVIIAILFMGGIQLLSVGLLGEYVGKTFAEVKRRPLYLVKRLHGFSEDTALHVLPHARPSAVQRIPKPRGAAPRAPSSS